MRPATSVKQVALQGHVQALGQLVTLLTRYRQLTLELTKREITERYAGQVLGPLWAIGHPLLLMAIYVVIFAFIFPSRFPIDETMPRGYVVYILAGLIPWLTFSESMNKGTGVIVGSANLVKQVAFPLEILPVKGVLASCVTQLVATAVLFVYVLVLDPRGLPLTALLLPGLFALQLLAMIGVAYVLSSIAVFFRDLRELVQVFTTAGLFLAPILYLPDWVEHAWPPLTAFLYANPFSHLVWCYQDAIYFGRIAHPVSWIVNIGLSLALFYGGFRLFRKLKTVFAEAL